MHLTILGCSGSAVPGRGLTSFLIDDNILLDAGTITDVLTLPKQALITDVLMTHAHLDHVKDLLFLADNLAGISDSVHKAPVRVHALPAVIDELRRLYFNNEVWPDFSIVPPDRPVLVFEPLTPGEAFELGGGYRAVCFPVRHTVPACGYAVWGTRQGEALGYSGDTGPCPEFWDFLAQLPVKVDTVITEVSFPNRLDAVAKASLHHTPASLAAELERLAAPPKILIYHLKAPFAEELTAEVTIELGRFPYHILQDGETFDF